MTAKIATAISISFLASIVAIAAIAAIIPISLYAATNGQTLNAKLLPTVWYSTTRPLTDGDSLHIYGAIQNNSGVDFSGKAYFLVDDAIAAQAAFSSVSGVLTPLDAAWTAKQGSHTISIKIGIDTPLDEPLESYESQSSSISVAAPPPPPLALPSISIASSAEALASVGSITDLATGISRGIDTAAQTLALKIESLKSSGASQGKVLGASTEKGAQTGSHSGNALLDPLISALALIVRHWVWTLSALLALWVLWKLKSAE